MWLLCAFASGPVFALEYRSIADAVALLYDAPSKDSTKRLILTKGYPVEVVIASGNWLRVRDDGGAFAWIESSRLDDKRTVMVIEQEAIARGAPKDAAPIVFKAQKGVVLEFVGISGGWAKVRHSSGVVAFIRSSALWGV